MNTKPSIPFDSILQWNINGLNSNKLELRQLLNQYNPFCVCLNETRLTNHQQIIERSFKNYSAFIDQNRHNPGNIIIIRKDINFAPVALNTTLNAIAVEVERGGQKLRICSIYLSPNIAINLPVISDFISQLSPPNSSTPFVILGDFNARSQYWYDSINNDRGSKILDVILQYNLEILNDDSPTHFNFTHRCQTNIDLSLCTKDIATSLHWIVHQDLCGSDHYPILIHFLNFTPKISKFRWKFNKADWPLFTYATRDIKYDHTLSCSSNLKYFTEKIILTGKDYIPHADTHTLSTHNPWWNTDCKKAKQNKNRARRKYIGTKDPCDLIEFKRLKAIARKVYHEAQRESWKTYVSNINSETSIKQIWNRVNKLRGKYKGSHTPSLKVNGNILNDPLNVANCIAETISQASKGLSSSYPPFAAKKKTEESKPFLFQTSENISYNIPFSTEELQAALSDCSNSSPGEDYISFIMIKHLHAEAQSTLLTIYNTIWSSGYFPPEWRNAIILPFLKPGKDPFNPQSYRPIALTSCLCKLMERMVNFRLMWYLEHNGLLSTHQYGFRKNRSTLDPLTSLEHDIGTSFSKSNFVTAVFFDVEKAYDTVWRHHILKVLKQKGLKGNLPTFIKNFLSPRHFKVNLNGQSSEVFNQYEGVPQGSILSTTCFILAIDGILKDLPSTVKKSLYVDDLAIWISGEKKRSHLIQRELQTAINYIQFYSNNNGFKISESKTTAITFYKGHKSPTIQLKLNSTPITFANHVKFLGIHLDEKMNWEHHIKKLKSSCLPILNLLKSLTNTRWGADRRTLLYLHSTLILSRLDYASHLYMAANESKLKLLDPIHNEGLRIATGAFKSSRIQSLYVECSSPSLKFRRAEYSLNYYSRILYANPRISRLIHSMKDIDTKRYLPFTKAIHNILCKYDIPKLHIIKYEHPPKEPWCLYSPSICTSELEEKKSNLAPQVLFQIYSDHLEKHQGLSKIYTDGSKSTGGVGFAIVTPSQNIKGKLPEQSSIFSAELTAINKALHTLFPQKKKSTIILTDSLSALDSLKSIKPSHPLATKIKQSIHSLSLINHKIELCWCPSHIGIKGNETADILAKSAANESHQRFEKTFHKDFKPLFKEKILSRWQLEWTAHINNMAEHDVMEIIKPQIKSWNPTSPLTRFEEVLLCRLRLGHTRLTHEYRMSQSTRTLCDLCHTPISIPHILIDCPKFSLPRKVFGINPTMKSVLHEETVNIRKIIEFLKVINILDRI